MRIFVAHVLDYCTAGSGPVFESDVSHSEKIVGKKNVKISSNLKPKAKQLL